MATAFFGGNFFGGEFFSDTEAEQAVKTGTGGIDPEGSHHKPYPVKPTGILHLPPKRGKLAPAVEERIGEAARDKAEIAHRLAREFTEETALLQRPAIESMTMAQIEAEIGVLLRKKVKTDDEEILLLFLISVAALA